MASGRFTHLLALLILSTCMVGINARSASRHAAMLNQLEARADSTCFNSTYTTCGKGLPGNICCPSTDSCYIFNSGRSVICCPPGKDCSSISTINCSISWQDVTKTPTSPIFTTELNTPMQSCGNLCCPNGMTCSNNNLCVADPNLLGTPTPSSSASNTATSAGSQSATGTSSSTTSSSTNNPSSTTSGAGSTAAVIATSTNKCNQFPITGVLVGFFSGLTAGIILASILLCCCGSGGGSSSRRGGAASTKDRPHSDFSSVTANVSDPIYQPGYSGRTDFLRRESESRNQHSPAPRLSRMRSFFMRGAATPNLHSRRAARGSKGSEMFLSPSSAAAAGGDEQQRTRSKRSNTTATTITTSTETSSDPRHSTATATGLVIHNDEQTGPRPRTPRTPNPSSPSHGQNAGSATATPQNRSLKKEPSMESIKIYSPPNIAHHGGMPHHQGIGLDLAPPLPPTLRAGVGGGHGGGDRITTFQEMMAEAGFREGQSYLGSPGKVDPRTRRVGDV